MNRDFSKAITTSNFFGIFNRSSLFHLNVIYSAKNGVFNSYLINLTDEVYVSLIIISSTEAILFNPTYSLTHVPYELTEALSCLFTVYSVAGDYINTVSLSLQTNCYFIELFPYLYPVKDSNIMNCVHVLFPKCISFSQQVENVVDFARTRFIL